MPKYLIVPECKVVVGIFKKLPLTGRTVVLDQLMELSETDENLCMCVIV